MFKKAMNENNNIIDVGLEKITFVDESKLTTIKDYDISVCGVLKEISFLSSIEQDEYNLYYECSKTINISVRKQSKKATNDNSTFFKCKKNKKRTVGYAFV